MELSILNEMRLNTNKTLAKIENYLTSSLGSNGFSTHSLLLSASSIVALSASVLSNPTMPTATFWASAITLVASTPITLLGTLISRQEEESRVMAEIKKSLDNNLYVLTKDNKVVDMSRREFYGKMANDDFYQENIGVLNTNRCKEKPENATQIYLLLEKPKTVRDFLNTEKYQQNDYSLDEYEKKLGKVLAIDSKSNVFNKIGQMRIKNNTTAAKDNLKI